MEIRDTLHHLLPSCSDSLQPHSNHPTGLLLLALHPDSATSCPSPVPQRGVVLLPRPALPHNTAPISTLYLSCDSATSTASAALYFRPVLNSIPTWETFGLQDSWCCSTSLVWVTMKSSFRLLMGILSLLFCLYKVMLFRLRCRSSHFRRNLLIPLSKPSTVEIRT